MTFFRSLGIRSIIYVDDILLFHSDPQTLRSEDLCYRLDQALNFVVNFQNFSVSLSQLIQFLRCEMDSVRSVLLLPAAKILAIKKELRWTL